MLYVQLAQLCVDTVVRLVAFHFTMGYHEPTVAMIKALQNWLIAKALYVTKVHALYVTKVHEWIYSQLCQQTRQVLPSFL